MARRQEWMALAHEDRVRLLRDLSIDLIAKDYTIRNQSDEDFKAYLARQRQLWEPDNVGTFEQAGGPPTKDIVLGAYRDLDRAEALLELIDNSIDVWFQRRAQHPRETARELKIVIDIDRSSGQLTYEDNAGGVPREKLPHLVVPGFSDTTALSKTIGSYKTGGKKAIFRLATAARVTTRYWNPAGTGDEAFSVQLDESWINEPTQYEFPFATLKDRSTIERGQTRYVLQLREEPLGAPWYNDPLGDEALLKHLQLTYSLLLLRTPAIKIFYRDKSKPILPLKDLYVFTGAQRAGIDIRPQQVVFETQLVHEGQQHPVEIEVVLGCRTSVAANEGGSWGIDLYGNDRLFVAFDQDTFSQLLPKGNQQRLVRGLVNIRGPNVFIPWDTHKRHLNVDREIVRILKAHTLITTLFENWKNAYNLVGRGNVSEIVKQPLSPTFEERDLFIPSRSKIRLDPTSKRGTLPKSVFVPQVGGGKKRGNDTVKVNLSFSSTEATVIAAHYDTKPEPRSMAAAIKADVIKRAKA